MYELVHHQEINDTRSAMTPIQTATEGHHSTRNNNANNTPASSAEPEPRNQFGGVGWAVPAGTDVTSLVRSICSQTRPIVIKRI